MLPVHVGIRTSDPLVRTGLAHFLETSPNLKVVGESDCAKAGVVVVAVQKLSPAAVAALPLLMSDNDAPIVLIAGEVDKDISIRTVGRVTALLPMQAVSGERLEQCVLAAASSAESTVTSLLGELVDHPGASQDDESALLVPQHRVSEREIDVLRLLADGLDTKEIAGQLNYSTRTVKYIIHDFTERMRLQNRTHAVAFAVRCGVI